MLCTDGIYNPATKKTQFFSAGFQPSWLNYMTDVNECYGEFAKEDSLMYMALNRRYESDENGRMSSVTTYIDPTKYNYAFANTALDSQNFMLQFGIGCIACRPRARHLQSVQT